MRINSVLAAVLIVLPLASPAMSSAQQPGTAAAFPGHADAVTPADSASHAHRPWFQRYRWNGVNVWAGGAVETRTASHNELFAGSMRIIGVQLTRDVWRSSRMRLAYAGEFLPVMLVGSGAPSKRLKNVLTDPTAFLNPARVQRYYHHDSHGVGFAPLGAEFSMRAIGSVSVLVNVTAGAALFSHVVPYGDATKANFTVSPGVALQWAGLNRAGVAVGYTMHHLSNASFGTANPGMNSHMFYARITHLRRR